MEYSIKFPSEILCFDFSSDSNYMAVALNDGSLFLRSKLASQEVEEEKDAEAKLFDVG